jgi:hypothetical protein
MQSEDYMSFLVRLWRDQPGNVQYCDWHGEIEHIQTGARWSFSTLETLLIFLHQAVIASHSIARSAPDEAVQLRPDNRRC